MAAKPLPNALSVAVRKPQNSMPATAKPRLLPARTPVAIAMLPSTVPKMRRSDCCRSPSSTQSPTASRKAPTPIQTSSGTRNARESSNGSTRPTMARTASAQFKRRTSKAKRSTASSRARECQLSEADASGAMDHPPDVRPPRRHLQLHRELVRFDHAGDSESLPLEKYFGEV